MKVIKGTERRPRRVLLYGTDGIGKSTWAAQAPGAIALQTEDGLADIGIDRSPVLRDLGSFNGWVSDLLNQEHDYRTVIVDSLDWLERLIHDQVATEAGKSHIEDIGYGKGYLQALKHWDFILRALDHLRVHRGMAVILLAHARITKFASPDSDSYDRYGPDLHKAASPMLQEWADEVLFATYRVDVIKQDEGFNRERTRAVGVGERIVHTTEGPTHLAKRRIKMPDVLPLDFNEYAKHVANGKPSPGNVDGIVKDGSSKKKETTDGKS